MENEIINIKEINKENSIYVGNKACNLAKMNNHFNIPNGFVITTIFFNKYFNFSKHFTKISNLNYDDYFEIENFSNKIKQEILNTQFTESDEKEIIKYVQQLNSKYLAVRSSSCSEDSINNSFAGQFDSYLNTNTNNLIYNIKKCFASFFSTRSLYYRNLKNIKKYNLDMAVLIQEQIEPEISGVIFYSKKIIPILGEDFILEFIRGKGEELVSGKKTPTKITLKSKNEIENLDIKTNIDELFKITKEIKKIHKFDPDIEFCIKNKKIYILQARPISF